MALKVLKILWKFGLPIASLTVSIVFNIIELKKGKKMVLNEEQEDSMADEIAWKIMQKMKDKNVIIVEDFQEV